MIYVDMDGVIADFTKRYKEKFGVSPEEARGKNFGPNFEKFIEDGEFGKLDTMPDMGLLIGYLNTLSIPKEILSSTANPENHGFIAPQKQMWLNKYGITYPTNFVPGKKHKAKYATPTSIIIDDTRSIIEDWNEAGGIGILHTDAVSTIAMLKMYV